MIPKYKRANSEARWQHDLGQITRRAWIKSYSKTNSTVGTPRDYKTHIKLMFRGLWTPHRAFLANCIHDDRCICGHQGTHLHIFHHCMFVQPLLEAFLDLCDHLHYNGLARRSFSPRDNIMGTINREVLPPGLLLFLFVLKKFYWIEFTSCKYGEQHIFRAPSAIWKDITYRVRSRIMSWIGVCSSEVKLIRYRAGRGQPMFKEYRLKKYEIKRWESKIKPLGDLRLTATGDNLKFFPVIKWTDIAARLD